MTGVRKAETYEHVPSDSSICCIFIRAAVDGRRMEKGKKKNERGEEIRILYC